MISIQTYINGNPVNKKYYKNNTEQTRQHYIDTLKRQYTGNQKVLDTINFYKDKFIVKKTNPFDDNFYFDMEKYHFDGIRLKDTFFAYEFHINSTQNLTILFSKDNVENRTIFANEVAFYLKNYDYIDLYERLLPYLKEFRMEDNQYLYVTQEKLAMRKEDD